MSAANTISFNVNDDVYVKLTETGREELKRQHEELRESFPNLGEVRFIKEDSEGYSKWQMHCLMNTFGHLMSMGNSFALPFETDIKLEHNQ